MAKYGQAIDRDSAQEMLARKLEQGAAAAQAEQERAQQAKQQEEAAKQQAKDQTADRAGSRGPASRGPPAGSRRGWSSRSSARP